MPTENWREVVDRRKYYNEILTAIESGNITSIKEGALWLKYTFLYQRMLNID